MKIKKLQLKQIIQEELNIVMHEADEGEEMMAALEDVPSAAEGIAADILSKIEDLAEPSGLDPSVLAQAIAALLTAD
tara:strand:+ start:96 stop:326 length:231 start_codon:yes stop_codon:yes gene_type:complete